MAKSIKLKNDTYIDATGVIYRRGNTKRTLSELTQTINYNSNGTAYPRYRRICKIELPNDWQEANLLLYIYSTEGVRNAWLITIQIRKGSSGGLSYSLIYGTKLGGATDGFNASEHLYLLYLGSGVFELWYCMPTNWVSLRFKTLEEYTQGTITYNTNLSSSTTELPTYTSIYKPTIT